MHRTRRRRPSLATVISLAALFVALGGTSYATVTKLLPKNSVGSAQVVNGSLQKRDLSTKAVQALKGPQGPAGPQGAQGAQGEPGPASEAYAQSQNAIQPLTGTGTPNELLALSLPAGAYTFTAKLQADNNNASASRVDCSVNGPSGFPLDTMMLRLGPTDTPNLEFGNFSLAGSLTLNTAGTLKLVCSTPESNGGVVVAYRTLIATKVGTLHA